MGVCFFCLFFVPFLAVVLLFEVEFLRLKVELGLLLQPSAWLRETCVGCAQL